MQTVAHARDFRSLPSRASKLSDCNKSLFHRRFLQLDDVRATHRRAFVQRCVKQTSCIARASTSAECAPRTRFVKRDTVFFVVL
jgi:hypothetical protein